MTSSPLDWQTTDEDEIEIPVRHVENMTPEKPPAIPRAERKTAAITGILVVLGIGLLFFGGLGGLLGQLTAADYTISIQQNSFSPDEVSVQLGQTVRFQNDSTIPHILSSDTLFDSTNQPFESTVILPGDHADLEIPTSTVNGDYEITSKTQQTLMAIIHVGTATNPIAQTQQVSSISNANENSNQTFVETSIVDDASLAIPQGSIPVNPHAINGSATQQYTPPPIQQTQPTSVQATNSVTNHMPAQNTESGIGIWTIVAIGMLAFVGIVRVVTR